MSEISTPLRALWPLTLNNGGTGGPPNLAFHDYVIAGTPGSTSTIVNATTITTGTAVARPIFVGWQAKDLSLFPAAYATSIAERFNVPFTPAPSPGTSSSLPSATTPLSASAPGSSTTGLSEPSSGLTTGAKAGIGVGAVLGFSLIIGLVVAILFMRRKRQQRVKVGVVDTGASTPEMEDQDQDLAKRKWYLGGRWRAEVDAPRKAGELDPIRRAAELDAPQKVGELDSRAVHVVPGPPAELDATDRRRET
jgi:hypothetical protein